jgi:hypothetical protein
LYWESPQREEFHGGAATAAKGAILYLRIVERLELNFNLVVANQENSGGEDGQVSAGPKHRALPQIAQFFDRRNRTTSDI